jgi:hypothetical protein
MQVQVSFVPHVIHGKLAFVVAVLSNYTTSNLFAKYEILVLLIKSGLV